jgi:DNA mismatch repair protein MutS2
MKISLDDVTAVIDESGSPKSATPMNYAPGVTVKSRPGDEPSADEINVIGATVKEASRRVDKFLSDAAVAGRPAVRIIHGHGTGALRRGLGEFLRTHPLVEHAAQEAEDRGGAAITIVTLKG